MEDTTNQTTLPENQAAVTSQEDAAQTYVETTETPSDAPHLLMSTPFTDYTVTEGLLLLIFITLILGFVVRLAKEVF